MLNHLLWTFKASVSFQCEKKEKKVKKNLDFYQTFSGAEVQA